MKITKHRLFSVLSAFMLAAVLILSGCGGKKLTKDEYLEAVRGSFKTYAQYAGEISDAIDSENYDSVKGTAEKIEKLFSELETAVPEDKYSQQHQKLCSSIDKEREWINNCVEFAEYGKKKDSLTAQETEELKKLNEKLENASTEFPETVLETVKLLASDTD